MSTPGWDIRLVCPALTLDGQTTQILTGRIRRGDRHLTVLRISDGPIAVLLPSAATELVANIHTLTGGEQW